MAVDNIHTSKTRVVFAKRRASGASYCGKLYLTDSYIPMRSRTIIRPNQEVRSQSSGPVLVIRVNSLASLLWVIFLVMVVVVAERRLHQATNRTTCASNREDIRWRRRAWFVLVLAKSAGEAGIELVVEKSSSRRGVHFGHQLEAAIRQAVY